MLIPIIMFLLVLSPLFIPTTVTVVHGFNNWRENRAARPVRSFPTFRPAAGPVPAAA